MPVTKRKRSAPKRAPAKRKVARRPAASKRTAARGSRSRLKLKTSAGKVIDLPVSAVKRVLKDAGYTGGLLVNAADGTYKEARRLAINGIVTSAKLEKAIVKSISNTNKRLANTAIKSAKRVLR